jgi:SAM-dependent methyltransferase
VSDTGDGPGTPPDIFHVEGDEEYRRLLREEEAYWDARTDTPLSRTQMPEIQAYMNERFTGRQDVAWYEAISEYGPFRRACMLGAGPGTVETDLLKRNAELTLIALDISSDALGRLHAKLEETFPGRSEVHQQDLNFVALPVDTYDLIVANSSMHHLVNVEHIAFQINRALTPDGYFFMHDTVGESYFQFDERKKRLFELLTDATSSPWQRRRVEWPDRGSWAFSPFESVRSGEILEIFRRYLREESVRTAWSLLAAGLFTKNSVPLRKGLVSRLRGHIRQLLLQPFTPLEIPRARAAAQLLFELDRILCDSGAMQPGLAFGVYRKRPSYSM